MFESLPAALLQQHSLWELVLAASPVAKFVLVLLLLASLMSWAVIFAKWSQFRNGGAANAAFLRTLEHAVGRERFDAWLRSWFDRHAFQPATSAMMLADLRANLVKGDAGLAKRLMLEEWIYQPGLPSNVYRPDAAAFAEVDGAVKAYAAARTVPAAATYKAWTSAERQRFLDNIPKSLPAVDLAKLDGTLGLSKTGNNEELFLWLELALANRYDPAVAQSEAFLSRVGRTKFVRPLFEVLMKQGSWGEPIAKRIYAKTRSGYHAVTRGAVDKVVGVGG